MGFSKNELSYKKERLEHYAPQGMIIQDKTENEESSSQTKEIKQLREDNKKLNDQIEVLGTLNIENAQLKIKIDKLMNIAELERTEQSCCAITMDYEDEYNRLSQKYLQMATENGQLIQTIINISKKL